MRNIYIDPLTNDFALDALNLRLTTDDIEYYGQKIENTLKTVLGEYYLDRSVGVPYYGPRGVIMKKNPDLNEVQALMVASIVGITGINNVEKYEASFSEGTRIYTASIRAMTDSGMTIEREITL